MKRVWSGGTLPDTTHFKNLLEQVGIGCIIKNRHLGGALGDLPLFECSPELWVLEDAHERRAAALLRDVVAPARGDPFAQPWRCARCAADNEEQFAACWRCGELDERAPA
jgi:hypothetical protein